MTVLVRTGNWYSRSMALKIESAIKKFPKHRKPFIVAFMTEKSSLPVRDTICPENKAKYKCLTEKLKKKSSFANPIYGKK